MWLTESNGTAWGLLGDLGLKPGSGEPEADLSPPYQRGTAWALEQRISLVRSWMTGLPAGAVTINDRWAGEWQGDDPGNVHWAVIDGKQRVETAILWYSGSLAVPASWFPAGDVAATTGDDDGDYVTHAGLTAAARRRTQGWTLASQRTRLPGIPEEAALYLAINGGGTPQGEGDMARAAAAARRDPASAPQSPCDS